MGSRRRRRHGRDRERAGGVLERDRHGVARLVGRLEHDLRPVEYRPADAGGHVLDDPHPEEPGLERAALRSLEAHPDGQECDRRAGPEQSIANDLHLADRYALDVVLAVGEQDQRRSDRVRWKVLGSLLHRRDVVRVDPDLPREGGIETLSVRARHGSQTVGEAGDGLRITEELQVRAALVVDRLRGELDDRHGGVARDEVRRCLVDASRDPLEGGTEASPVRRVLEDRGRKVEDEHDRGPIRCRHRARVRYEGPARQQGPDDDRDDELCSGTEATHKGPCMTRERTPFNSKQKY